METTSCPVVDEVAVPANTADNSTASALDLAQLEDLRRLPSPLYLHVGSPTRFPVGFNPVVVTLDIHNEKAWVADISQRLLGKKDKNIVVTCQTGVRAARAIALLHDCGYANVHNGSTPAALTEAGLPNQRPTATVRQLFDRATCTYTYIVLDTQSAEAVIIDPVLELADRDCAVLDIMGAKLKFILNTHVHADHITGSGKLRAVLGGKGHRVQTMISAASGAVADVLLHPGDCVDFGSSYLIARPTPGHTPGCMTFVLDDLSCAFTGDTLMVGGCGRTDFQGGNAGVLYESNWKQILTLPARTLLWPGHDYNGRTSTTVAEECTRNPRLTLPKTNFVDLMKERFDGSKYPGKIDISLPANMVCGVFECETFDPDGKPVRHPDGFVWKPKI